MAAVLLLGFPSILLYPAKTRKWLFSSRTTVDFSIRNSALTWQNWMDLVRGWGGAFLIHHHAFGVDPEVSDAGLTLWIWKGGVFAGLLFMQTLVWHRRRICFVAPAFLVAGMSFVLSDPLAVFYALVAAALLAAISENIEWFFALSAGVLSMLGYFWVGLNLALILNCGILFFPLLLTFLGRGRMTPLMRKVAAVD